MIVYFLNPRTLDVVGLIDDYKTLVWSERYNEFGDFELSLPIQYFDKEFIQIRNLLMVEDSSVLMILEDIKIQRDLEESLIVLSGRSVEAYLNMRVNLERKNWDCKIGEMVYNLLWQNIQNPVDPKRYFSVIDDTQVLPPERLIPDKNIRGLVERDTLYNIFRQYCVVTDTGFKFTKIGNKLQFRLYEGTDRSLFQEERTPVIFSREFGNLVSTNRYESHRDRLTTVYIYTDVPEYPEYSWRQQQRLGATIQQDNKRYEGYYEARVDTNISGEDWYVGSKVLEQIANQGRDYMEHNGKVKLLIDGEFDLQGNFKFGTDFFMGDLLQVVENDESLRARLVEVIRSDSADGYLITGTMDFMSPYTLDNS